MNTAAMKAYWMAPIPRVICLSVALGQAIGTTYVVSKGVKKLVYATNVEIMERDERINILLEATRTLMNEASPETLAKLDGELDFWRQIRGLDPNGVPGSIEEDGHMSWCARTDCYKVAGPTGEKNICVDYAERHQEES